MEDIIEVVKLVTALLGLITAVVGLLAKSAGRRPFKEEA